MNCRLGKPGCLLQKRTEEQRRAELTDAVREARKEFKAGRCRPASPQELCSQGPLVKRLLLPTSAFVRSGRKKTTGLLATDADFASLRHPAIATKLGSMIIVRFADEESKRMALGHLAGRFSFKSWASGEMMVPKDALSLLADEGVRFSVEGPATYERLASLRNPAAAEVQ